MLFLLTTLFFIPFSLSIERILNQTIGTSSSVNQAPPTCLETVGQLWPRQLHELRDHPVDYNYPISNEV